MSTQFGGGSAAGSGGRNTDTRMDDGSCRADELRGLIERIAQQLTDAEQRQTYTLERMLTRVEQLGAEARSYKGRVPEQYVPAFERIEDGVNMLADRIASVRETDEAPYAPAVRAPMFAAAQPEPVAAEPSQPMASQITTQIEHKFAAPAPAAPKPAAATSAAYVLEPVMANDEAAWDEAAADALTSHYEETLGAAVARVPDPELASVKSSQVPLALASAGPASTSPSSIRFLDADRDWLDGRLIDIARRVEISLESIKPEPVISILDARFDQFQSSFSSALDNLASHADVEGLRLIEAHITELTERFEEARQQLGRLDGIEMTLQAVVDRLSDPRFDSALERGAEGTQDLEPLISSAVEQIAASFRESQNHAAPDLAGLADAAAERIASRFADMGQGDASSGEDVYAVRQLLEQFINERREGEEQTAAMLDTMQQAMIRMLDRVDALEVTNSKSTPQEYVREHVRFAAEATAGAQRTADAAGAFATKARSMSEPEPRQPAAHDFEPEQDAEEPSVRPFAAPRSPASSEARGAASSPASIERLRQDFIADAQRAKVKAAANIGNPLAGAAADQFASPGRVQITEPPPAAVAIGKGRKSADAAIETSASSVTSNLRKPSRKLLVSAIVLMIAIPGLFLLMKKKAAAPTAAPTAIEKSEQPSDRGIMPIKPAATTPVTETAPMAPAAAMPQRETPIEKSAPAAAPATTPSPQGAREIEIPQKATQAPAGQDAGAPTADAPAAGTKDDLFRTTPKTRTRGMSEEIEAPDEVKIDRNSSIEDAIRNSATPPAGITVAKPARAPTLSQLERLEERQATAHLSSQLGAAQVEAVPSALIPQFMRDGAPQSTVQATPQTVSLHQARTTADAQSQAPLAKSAGSENRRQALDMPSAAVGPLSLRLAAAKGDPSAEFEVGARFAEGKGIEQNFNEAQRWYQRSATRGFAQAQYRLATLFERGMGVKQDLARAKTWYQRAAEQGNVKAMHNLAVLSAGRAAKTPDYATASRWFQSAADHGLADSQFNLAVLHESGLGVAKDMGLAYKWFALAAKQGDAEAIRRRDDLDKTMQPDELAASRRSIDSWRPKEANRLANDPLAAGEAWKSRAAAGGDI